MLVECTPSLPTEPILSPPKGDDYRDLAGKIREVARQTRLTVARNELLQLASHAATEEPIISSGRARFACSLLSRNQT